VSKFALSRGGFVRFSMEDVQAYGPKYEDCYVTLMNGITYLLAGREPLEIFKRWGL